jgi:hypothetical protein
MLIVSEMFRLLLGLCSGDIGKWIRKGFNFVFKKDALGLKLHEASLLQPGLRAIAAFLTSGVFSQSELSLILLSMPLKLVVSLLIRWRWWLLLGHYSFQVYVSCHYCGKSVSPWYKGLPRVGKTGSLQRTGGAANKVLCPKVACCQLQMFLQVKLQSCPSCKKPLPRCSVCLVNMGTASGSNVLAGSESDR